MSRLMETVKAMTLAIEIQELQAGTVVARCPLLPGCVGFGATREEACREIAAALTDYFADVQRIPMGYFGGMAGGFRN